MAAIYPGLKKQFDKIHEDCMVWLRNTETIRRFSLTIGTEEFRFNHGVIVDTNFIINKPIIHMVDVSCHFLATCSLRNQTTD